MNLTYQERKVLLFICFLLALGLFLSFFKKSTGRNVCLLKLYSSRDNNVSGGVSSDGFGERVLNVNLATRQELITLPGIGEKTADAIIALRTAEGSIKDLSELKKIKGITESRFEVLKKYLQVK